MDGSNEEILNFIKIRLGLNFEITEEDLIRMMSNHEAYLKPQDNLNPKDQTFEINQDLIFSGCSNTHGVHVSEVYDLAPPYSKLLDGDYKTIWGFKIADHFGFSAVNLAQSGDSVMLIVKKLFSHFERYGNPKNLLCLFPDIFRLTLPKDPTALINQRQVDNPGNLETTFLDYTEVDRQYKYDKKPFKKEIVLPNVIPVWLNLQYVLMLEQYCNSNGIKFLYSSWSESFLDAVRYSNELSIRNGMPKIYKNFVDIEPYENPDRYLTYFNCHEDLKKEWPDLFDYGSDGAHIGMHRHAHIAEAFIKEMSNE